MNTDFLKKLEFIQFPCLVVKFITLKGVRKNSYEIFRKLFKTNPIFARIGLKTRISMKNKANSNPIQSQTKPILGKKLGGQSQNKPNFFSESKS